MFASPSPKNNRLNKCTSQGEISQYTIATNSKKKY